MKDAAKWVASIIEMLDLQKCADVVVKVEGDFGGISGGQVFKKNDLNCRRLLNSILLVA